MSDLTPRPEPPRFVLPAEYYASPVTARPIVAGWVPKGCGIASAVLLLIAFAGGAVVMTIGVGKLLSTLIDTTHTEMKGMYGADVTKEKRARVDGAIDGISHDLATDKLAYAKLEPLLITMRDAMDDKKITNAEADQLLAKSEEVRRPAPRPSPGATRHPLPRGEGK